MIADRNAGGTSPVGWVGSFPVYTSTVIAAAHAVTMLLTAVAMAAGAGSLIHAFSFSSSMVLGRFAFWQLATYAFVHPPGLLFLLEIYLLVVFGKEIEGFLGRVAFLKLYALLLVLPPLALCGAALLGFPSTYVGSSALHFGVFIAFATLYPSAEVFFGVQARWVALALFAVSALQYLAYSAGAGLVVLVLDTGAAFAAIKVQKGEWALPRFPSGPRLRIVRKEETEAPESAASIDSILEKISRSGMASLTSKEKARLELARSELLRKDTNP